ncbi:MAG: CRISPR-associated endonuclease Cas3'', partial [Armatimonadota bacterium]|nr:CRISPR-associated endonuclease Cas3'' [Armatimonadota bacterium]MDW8143584.1 CRISPR-associated endonuclease Cas3'' [Armatimonadota bacterium]
PLQPKVKPELKSALRKETWIEHAVKTVCEIEKLLEQDKLAVKGLAKLLGVTEEDVKRAAKLAALLHDFGKLTAKWQQLAGVHENSDAEKLLAHTAQRDYAHFPSHATVSAYALWDAFKEAVPCHLGRAVLFAIAHHHSVRAQQVPDYKLHGGWQEAVTLAMNQAGLNGLSLDKVNREQQSTTELGKQFPQLESEHLYTAYVLLSKWLRLADRIATEGSEDAIFRYEDWFGNL